MKKFLLIVIAALTTSCTYYTEKQSEAVSQSVYATTDSLEKARVDLAYYYSIETTKLINPPKNPIAISPIYDAGNVVKESPAGEKTRVVVVPENYRNDKVIVVGSSEYQALLKDQNIKQQLERDNQNLIKQREITAAERVKQDGMNSKMVKDLNHLQSQVYKKDAIILKLIIALSITWLLVAGYIYMRMNRFAPF